MMIPGVLIFSIVVFIVSYLVARAGTGDQGKTSTAIALIAWGSLLLGIFISRVAP